MNKKCLFAALFGALFFTACSVEDNPSESIEPVFVPVDMTKIVSTSGWGQGGFAGWAAPEITTADGRKAAMAEVYRTSVDETGIIMQQELNVENGTYAVEVYANSFFTSGRGFDSDMKDGATDVAYVFANEVKTPIVAKVADSTTENGLYAMEVKVTDGKLTIGLGKEKAGTNWHTIQIKSLTLLTGSTPKEDKNKVDFTELVIASEWEGKTGMVPDWAAPKVETSDGRQTELAEKYYEGNDNVAATGVIMQQTIEIKNGKYAVELYATAYYTPERGFDSELVDGAEDVAYVFANNDKTFIKANVGTSFTQAGVYAINTTVTDGKLTLGLAKEKGGTNWHTIQIKSLKLVK